MEKRVFVNIIRDLRVESPWVIWVVLNPVTTVLPRDRREDTVEGGESPAKMEGETGVMPHQPRDTQSRWKPDEAGNSLPKTTVGSTTPPTPQSQNSGLQKYDSINFYCSKACGNLSWQSQETEQPNLLLINVPL